MARVKNSTPRIRRSRIAIPLMAVSLAVVTLIVLFFLDYRSQGLGLFKTQLDRVTDKFETVEKTYHSLLTTLLANRSPVPEFTISVVEDSYTEILGDITEVESTISGPTTINSLRNIIVTRQSSLQEIRTMNKALRAEELIGNSLTSYTACKKAISYTQKAAQIVSKLTVCKLELTTALDTINDIPSESIKGCTSRHTPLFYVQRMIKAHDYLASSYTYSSKGKAKEAATTDIAYQKVIDEIQQLPDWNTCISTYLQTTATKLLGD